MTLHCLSPEQVPEVLALPASDPRRRHADECARCRALLLDYREFVDPVEPLAGASVATARLRLEASLARELADPGAAPAPSALRPTKGVPWVVRWRPLLASAAVLLAASAIVVALRPRLIGTVDDALRTAPSVDSLTARIRLTTLTPVTRDDGGLELGWHRFPGADSYDVRFYGPDLTEIARLGPFADTSLVIERDVLPLGSRPGQTLGWRVVALQDRDEIATSAAVLVRLPGAPQSR